MRAFAAAAVCLLFAVAPSPGQETPPPPVYEGKDSASWLEDLRTGDVPARKKAVYALWKMGPAMKEGVGDLGSALSDPDPYVADVAGRILVRLGTAAAGALDGAAVALEDERPKVRVAAVRLLRVMGEPAKGAAGTLLSLLDDPEAEVRQATAQAFGTLGYFVGSTGFASQVVAGLGGALEDPDPGVRKEAAFALSNYGDGALAAIDALVARLGDESAEVRAFAANALWNLGSAAGPEALDGLYGLLGDPDAMVRSRAYGGIVGMGPEDPRLFEAMRRGMEDTAPEVRQTCSWILGTRFGERPGVVDRLLAATADPAHQVRLNAFTCLSKVRPIPAGVFTAFEKGLKDREPQIRANCAQCLGEIGPEAAPFVPLLVEMLRDTEDLNAQVATTALGRIGTAAAEAIPDLRRRWRTRRDPYEKTNAGYSLARVSPRDRPEVLESFLAVLRGESARIPVLQAANGVGEIGPEAAAAVPLLRPLLASEDRATRITAVMSLGKMGRAGGEAIPDLERLLRDPWDRLRERAKVALDAIRAAQEGGR